MLMTKPDCQFFNSDNFSRWPRSGQKGLAIDGKILHMRFEKVILSVCPSVHNLVCIGPDYTVVNCRIVTLLLYKIIFSRELFFVSRAFICCQINL